MVMTPMGRFQEITDGASEAHGFAVAGRVTTIQRLNLCLFQYKHVNLPQS